MPKVIWIDLWTTNSAFAYMLGDKAEIISNAEGDRTTPSVVYIKWDQLLVWKLAKRKAILEPKNVVYEAKRFIGRKYSEIKQEMDQVPYTIKEWKDGGVLIEIDWKDYKPEQIAAFVLKKIKEDAEKFLNDKVEKAVITVPAYFNDSQRNATKAAWEIAGLTVERIINEPTAAALAYWMNNTKDEKVAVFDFWGGTFDVTVLEIWAEWTFQVLATSWDTHLGWADIDKILIDFLADTFKQKEGIDLRGNAMAMQRLKEEAENAKIALSQAEQVEIMAAFITMWPDWQPRNLHETITRAQFEKMISAIVEKTVGPTLSAIKDSGLSANDINEVILVWGSTRIPLVRKRVEQIFGKAPKMTVNPDEAVALWAAIQAWIIQWDVTDILLLDVSPLSLWVEVEGGMVDVVIPRNTTVPVRKSKVYSTAVDNQPAVTIHVLQGERTMASDNKSLGNFNLDGIPPMRRGQAQIEVTFDIDASWILSVSAKEKTTNKEQKVTIQWATNLSDEEIKKAQEEAERFAEEDKKKKELIEAKNWLESTAYQLETSMADMKDKLSQEEQDKISAFVSEAKAIKENPESTKEEADAKMKEIQEFVSAIYQRVGAAEQSQPSAQGPESGADAAQDVEIHDAK